MGGGKWSNADYTSRSTSRLADHGTHFVHDAAMSSVPREERKAHETLDPKSTNSDGAHAGLITREALDSDEHPESLPIVVMFDVTGSMGRIPKVLQEKLPSLHGLLMRKGYVEHPQILFGAVGDAQSLDKVPLQVSQFESDNRMDEHLSNIYLEGGGGGGNHESYELAAYYLARHTYLDSWEKRGKKGYVFFIGDERLYPNVSATAITEFIGDNPQGDLTTREVFQELGERYEVFFLYADQASYTKEQVIGAPETPDAIGWEELLGQNALVMEDAEAVCATIALTIGIMEGAISLNEGLDDLASIDGALVESTSKALAGIGAGSGGGTAVVEGELDVADDAATGTEVV